jgi:protein-disulfide isomerase
MSESGKNRRDKAAAARESAQAAERRRERIVRIVGAVTVVVVVVGIIAVALIARNSSSDQTASGSGTATQPDPSAPSPNGALPGDDAHAYGVPYGSNPDAPILAIWEDFQCPACGTVEALNGAGIEALADAGTVQVVWRPTTFLDRNLGTDASERAAAAFGCAVDQGSGKEYHNVVFANQPEVEGTGWTDAELVAFGEQAGVPDLAAFTTCVNEGTFRPWAANSTQVFYDSGIPGTPFATLDGVEVPNDVLADKVKLEEFVASAASSAAPSPSS